MKHSSRPSQLALLLPAVVAAVALTACGREDDGRTAGQRLDDGISKMEQKSEEAKQDTRQAMDNMGNKMDRTADKVGAAVDDAQITTSIKTALAGDPKLSALDVKVETEKGVDYAKFRTYSWTAGQPSADKAIDGQIIAAVDRDAAHFIRAAGTGWTLQGSFGLTPEIFSNGTRTLVASQPIETTGSGEVFVDDVNDSGAVTAHTNVSKDKKLTAD